MVILLDEVGSQHGSLTCERWRLLWLDETCPRDVDARGEPRG